ncbi:MAG: hypothetical protein WCC27_07390 [Acidobacteriaceae bacterium]
MAKEIVVMEATLMKPIRLISTGLLFLFLGAIAPTFAQEEQEAKPEKQHQQTKPQKQQESRPGKQEQQQARGQEQQQQKQQQQQAKTANQDEQRQAKSQQQQQQKQQQQQAKATNQDEQRQARAQQNQEKSQQREQAQGQWAHNGQNDGRGHEYNESRFGREHHARFEENGGRFFNGRREYSYGGYWFYADAWPAWFYQQDVYFVMGADGLWYAVSYDDPSLMFRINVE